MTPLNDNLPPLLVVEDEKNTRDGLRRYFDGKFDIYLAVDVASAMNLLETQPVDVLLTDIVMPGGLDGVKLARIAQKRWPALKIVLTSGFPQARVEGNGGLPGGLNLLSKPYHREELAATLRAALDG